MAHVATESIFQCVSTVEVVSKKPDRVGAGLVSRLLDAMWRSRQKQTETEIFDHVRGCGGKFTDQVERQIECRFLGGEQW